MRPGLVVSSSILHWFVHTTHTVNKGMWCDKRQFRNRGSVPHRLLSFGICSCSNKVHTVAIVFHLDHGLHSAQSRGCIHVIVLYTSQKMWFLSKCAVPEILGSSALSCYVLSVVLPTDCGSQARKTCWFSYCKMWSDVGHAGIFGILHLAYYVLGLIKSFPGAVYSMAVWPL